VPSGIALLNDLDLGVPILPALLSLVSRDDENIVRVVGNRSPVEPMLQPPPELLPLRAELPLPKAGLNDSSTSTAL